MKIQQKDLNFKNKSTGLPKDFYQFQSLYIHVDGDGYMRI